MEGKVDEVFGLTLMLSLKEYWKMFLGVEAVEF